jgi:hypothetical protein
VGAGPRGRYYVQGYSGRKICDVKLGRAVRQPLCCNEASLWHGKAAELEHAAGLRTKRAIGTEEDELWPFERLIRPPGTSGGRTPFRP